MCFSLGFAFQVVFSLKTHLRQKMGTSFLGTQTDPPQFPQLQVCKSEEGFIIFSSLSINK